MIRGFLVFFFLLGVHVFYANGNSLFKPTFPGFFIPEFYDFYTLKSMSVIDSGRANTHVVGSGSPLSSVVNPATLSAGAPIVVEASYDVVNKAELKGSSVYSTMSHESMYSMGVSATVFGDSSMGLVYSTQRKFEYSSIGFTQKNLVIPFSYRVRESLRVGVAFSKNTYSFDNIITGFRNDGDSVTVLTGNKEISMSYYKFGVTYTPIEDLELGWSYSPKKSTDYRLIFEYEDSGVYTTQQVGLVEPKVVIFGGKYTVLEWFDIYGEYETKDYSEVASEEVMHVLKVGRIGFEAPVHDRVRLRAGYIKKSNYYSLQGEYKIDPTADDSEFLYDFATTIMTCGFTVSYKRYNWSLSYQKDTHSEYGGSSIVTGLLINI